MSTCSPRALPVCPPAELMFWQLRFRFYVAAGDAFTAVFVAARRRGVRLGVAFALASRCYAAARRLCEK